MVRRFKSPDTAQGVAWGPSGPVGGVGGVGGPPVHWTPIEPMSPAELSKYCSSSWLAVGELEMKLPHSRDHIIYYISRIWKLKSSSLTATFWGSDS